VFAVLTPQVFEVMEADTVAAQAATLQSGEAALLAEIDTLQGQPDMQMLSNMTPPTLLKSTWLQQIPRTSQQL